MELTGDFVRRLLDALGDTGRTDVEWSESIEPPTDPNQFALEAIFVICNSGMKNTVAQRIFNRVEQALADGESASKVFGHKGKAGAIDLIWRMRCGLHGAFLACESDSERLANLADLPWIGNITKYHLAKNFGVNVAKPDVHMQRLADHAGEDVQAMCERLAGETGLRTATVDLILWRACATGLIDSRSGRSARSLGEE
jgi:hypothetical protein